MTIDEALAEIKRYRNSWVVWRTDTGEIVSVTGFVEEATPEEIIAALGSLQKAGDFPRMGRFLEGRKVSR